MLISHKPTLLKQLILLHYQYYIHTKIQVIYINIFAEQTPLCVLWRMVQSTSALIRTCYFMPVSHSPL